ncbi:hypothetical protein LCGC14_0329940 [marine sediment metagenome]|uniref:Uncharacterized protein n=1 Tax=marine sediment metagenome TaxID=412755 RepID=A0A0F9W420_9ZZZZ
MSDREEVCWLVCSILGGLFFLVGAVGYVKLETARIKAEAQVKVVQEFGEGLVGAIEAWKD